MQRGHTNVKSIRHVTYDQIIGSNPIGPLPWPFSTIKMYDMFQWGDKAAMTYWYYDSSGTIGLGAARFQTSAVSAFC
jgi:hypothetical protein